MSIYSTVQTQRALCARGEHDLGKVLATRVPTGRIALSGLKFLSGFAIDASKQGKGLSIRTVCRGCGLVPGHV